MIIITKEAELTGHSSGIYAIDNGNRPDTIFTGSGDKFVAEWDLESKAPEKFAIKLDSLVYSICHIVAKQLLIIGNAAGGIHWIDLASKQEVNHFTYHQKGIFRLSYNSLTDQLVAASGDGTLSVWNVSDRKHIRTLYLCEEKIRALALSPDLKQLAVGSGDNLIRIVDTEHYNELYTLKQHTDSVNSLAWHPTNGKLISGGKDAYINVWNARNEFELIESIPAHNFAVYGLDFSPDGKYLASCSRDKTVKIWKASDLQLIKRLDVKHAKAHTHSVNTLMWHKHRNELITAGDDRKIIIWKIQEPSFSLNYVTS